MLLLRKNETPGCDNRYSVSPTNECTAEEYEMHQVWKNHKFILS